MSIHTREKIAEHIYKCLFDKKEILRDSFKDSFETIGHFYIDDLLPEDIALTIFNSFPKEQETVLKKSLKEHKHVAVQMNKYNSILEETIYAFQQPKIVSLIEEICSLQGLFPDDNLYAGGLSMMQKDNFLNPHLDNSHDKDRNMWRALNLLYYVTPDWKIENGGNLELWPKGPKQDQITIHSKFNRLVVMATHNNSWHSVSKVNIESTRCCVSNYYFTKSSIVENSKFHVTTFRGRPNQKIRDIYLKMDSFARMQIRKIFKKGVVENPHKYVKKD